MSDQVMRGADVAGDGESRRASDIQALGLAAGILGVILLLCLVATIWPGAI